MKTLTTPVDFARSVVCVMGLPFDTLAMNEAANCVRAAAKRRTPLMLSTANLNFVVTARGDEAFRDSIIRSQLSLADGMPIVWVARLLGLPIRERVPGSGLFDALMNPCDPEPAVKVFFFGGPDGVAQTASERINRRNGGVVCVGFDSPGFVPIDAMSGGNYVKRINHADPDFVVVSLGARKGQAWIERNRAHLNAPVVSHLGAVVNFAAGSVRRAPMWMQRAGLEWLWRVKEEPRLWKRYAADGVAFAHIIFASVLPLWWERVRASRRTQAPPPTVELRACETLVELKISGVCAAHNTAPLRSAFTQAAATGSRIRIDLTNVDSIDSTAMGILLLLHGHQRDIGRALELHGVSDLLQKQFRYHGTEFLLLQEAHHALPLQEVKRRHV